MLKYLIFGQKMFSLAPIYDANVDTFDEKTRLVMLKHLAENDVKRHSDIMHKESGMQEDLSVICKLTSGYLINAGLYAIASRSQSLEMSDFPTI